MLIILRAARGTKRKFDFDETTVETLAREAEEAAPKMSMARGKVLEEAKKAIVLGVGEGGRRALSLVVVGEPSCSETGVGSADWGMCRACGCRKVDVDGQVAVRTWSRRGEGADGERACEREDGQRQLQLGLADGRDC